MDVNDDIPQYYASHAEVSSTLHDISIWFGRLPAKLKPEAVEELRESGVLRVPADVQIVIPTTLLRGLIHALSIQKEQYEKQYGTILKNSASGELGDD